EHLRPPAAGGAVAGHLAQPNERGVAHQFDERVVYVHRDVLVVQKSFERGAPGRPRSGARGRGRGSGWIPFPTVAATPTAGINGPGRGSKLDHGGSAAPGGSL